MLDRAPVASLPLEDRLRRLDLVDGPGPDPARWIPVRSRLPLLRPDTPAVWCPVPAVHTAGGHAWRARTLSAEELAIWRAVDGRRTGGEVAARAGVALRAVADLWAWATDPGVQAGQWRDVPVDPRDPSLLRLVGVPRESGSRSDHQRDEDGATTLVRWHLELSAVNTHFDDVETTVAHAHALPHPALGGRRYGEALADALAPWPDGLVVEIGCGTGDLAAAVTNRIRNRYLRVDLAPALLRLQADRAPETLGVAADGTRLPLRDGSVARVISNEVIADLEASPRPDPAELAAWGIHREPRTYNVGAMRMIAEIARVLAPGGSAFVSEFGDPTAPPEEAVQLDHPEVSIRFDDLVAVARECGLRARVARLDELLGFDLGATQLARIHHEGLRAMRRAEGGSLPARAWTPGQLADALPWPVEGLRWAPISEPGAGPLVTRFWALLLEKPAATRG